jgi:hypothetical protein
MYSLEGCVDALVECEWSGSLVQHWQHEVLSQGQYPTSRPFVKPM